MRLRLVLAIVPLLLGGCASRGSTTTGMTSDRLSGPARQGSTNVITAEEMNAQSFQNAWQAVISLRPAWPRIPAYYRGRMAFERLQEIPIRDIKEIRMLSREQARVRFGPDAQQTILVVPR